MSFFTPRPTGLTWWTAFFHVFSRPWNPWIGCATSWRTGKSWRRWWWPLWRETSFVRWGGGFGFGWWLGSKGIPWKSIRTKQFVAGRLRMIHGLQGFLVLPMVKVWSTWTSWGLIGVKALVIKKAEWVSWNPWCRATAQIRVIKFGSPEINPFQWPNTNYRCTSWVFS